MEKFQLDLMHGNNLSFCEKFRFSKEREKELIIAMAHAIQHNRLKTDALQEVLLHCTNFNEAIYVSIVFGAFDISVTQALEYLEQKLANPFPNISKN